MEESKFVQRLKVAKLIAGALAFIVATAALVYKLITGAEWITVLTQVLSTFALS